MCYYLNVHFQGQRVNNILRMNYDFSILRIMTADNRGCASLHISTLFFLGRVTNPSTKPPFLKDKYVSLSLARLPKHALNYKPRGRRDRGRPRK